MNHNKDHKHPYVSISLGVCLVAQFCLTLGDTMDYSLPGSSVHGDSPDNNTGVGYHALLQEIFPNQCSNPDLSHCRQILYCLSHQGNQSTGGGSLPLLQGIFPIHESIQGLLHCRQILYQLSYQGSS